MWKGKWGLAGWLSEQRDPSPRLRTHTAEKNWHLKAVLWPRHTTGRPIPNEHKVGDIRCGFRKKGGSEQLTQSYPQSSSTQQGGSWSPGGIPRLLSSRHRELSTGLCPVNVLQFATCLCFIASSMEIFNKQKERGYETGGFIKRTRGDTGQPKCSALWALLGSRRVHRSHRCSRALKPMANWKYLR